MKILRRGSSGPEVRRFQTFLAGQSLYRALIDGKFGPLTEAATREFQRKHSLDVDGVVGNQTLGMAMTLGYPVLVDPDPSAEESFPPPPADLSALSLARRKALFGTFDFEPAPTDANPEAIRMLGSWQKENLMSVEVPELAGIRGAPRNKKVLFHRAAASQLKALFSAWDDAGLLHLVLTWGGSFAPRFVRGSRTSLSNHAWAAAFDVNAAWNAMGRMPALRGEKGSVRELVEIANRHGFFWGGHYKGRADGMHFECARVGATTSSLRFNPQTPSS